MENGVEERLAQLLQLITIKYISTFTCPWCVIIEVKFPKPLQDVRFNVAVTAVYFFLKFVFLFLPLIDNEIHKSFGNTSGVCRKECEIEREITSHHREGPGS